VNNATSAGDKSLKKSLTIATMIMMGSVFLSRVIGLVREQVIAGYGGTSAEIDAYVTAFVIPELLNHFLAGGFLSITFIPIFQQYLVRKDPDGAWRAFSNLITVGTIAFAIVIPLSVMFAPEVYKLFGTHISGDARTFALTVKLTRIILPAQIFFYWGAFFSAIQMAQHRFFLPALSPLLYNAGIIAGGLLFGRRFGIEGFAWGVLAGAFAGNVLLLLPAAKKSGMRYRARFDLRDPDLKRFVFLSIPVVLGLGMTFSNEIFFRYFSSFLGEGGAASINYALRTMGFVVAVFGQASGVAFFPYLSRLAAEAKFSEITILMNRVLTKIAAFCIPLSLLIAVLAQQVIALLYQHGKFGAASTGKTAPVFALYMLGAFAFSSAVFVVRPFYAAQKPYIPMIVSSAVSLLSLPLFYFSSKWWGALGIAGSTVAGMVVQFGVLYAIWNARFGDRASFVKLLRTLAIAAAVAAAGAALSWLAKTELLKVNFGFGRLAGLTIVCALASIPTAVVTLAVYHFTGVQKVGDMMRFLTRRK
jgi:putative peptidoglycan lipid II flippase